MNDEKTVDKIIFITIPLVSLKQTRKQEKQAQKRGMKLFSLLGNFTTFYCFLKQSFLKM